VSVRELFKGVSDSEREQLIECLQDRLRMRCAAKRICMLWRLRTKQKRIDKPPEEQGRRTQTTIMHMDSGVGRSIFSGLLKTGKSKSQNVLMPHMLPLNVNGKRRSFAGFRRRSKDIVLGLGSTTTGSPPAWGSKSEGDLLPDRSQTAVALPEDDEGDSDEEPVRQVNNAAHPTMAMSTVSEEDHRSLDREVEKPKQEEEPKIISAYARKAGREAYQAMLEAEALGFVVIVEKCVVLTDVQDGQQALLFCALQQIINREREVSRDRGSQE
jgi:hypothetical protein